MYVTSGNVISLLQLALFYNENAMKYKINLITLRDQKLNDIIKKILVQKIKKK